MEEIIKTDVVIVGGGLAGLVAALRLGREGVKAVVLDDSLPEANGALGGFAAFSGAKFSFPPAGQGLVPVAGSAEKLDSIINSVLDLLGLNRAECELSSDIPEHEEESKSAGELHRKYNSIVLSPSEINELIDRLKNKCEECAIVVDGRAKSLSSSHGRWQLDIETRAKEVSRIECSAVFYAAGRMSTHLLSNAGAVKTSGKGLDIGFRVEMINKKGLAKLRSLGPDAKILMGDCRTFCLNYPGEIYRYPYENISIPGGVVAEKSASSANVGLLCRIKNKEEELPRIKEEAENYYKELMGFSKEIRNQRPFGEEKRVLEKVFGEFALHQLEVFCGSLADLEMIDWSADHKLHFPLIDWHWPTFALPESHQTSLENVFAIGDSSGHARGLLQAAVSGWVGAEEFLYG